MKIKVSYTDEDEALSVMVLLKPLLGCFKVKKCEGTPPFKHLYFTPKKAEKPGNEGIGA